MKKVFRALNRLAGAIFLFFHPERRRVRSGLFHVDQIQRTLELDIGWRKKWKQYFCTVIEDEKEVQQVMTDCRVHILDLKNVEVIRLEHQFASMVRGIVECGYTGSIGIRHIELPIYTSNRMEQAKE